MSKLQRADMAVRAPCRFMAPTRDQPAVGRGPSRAVTGALAFGLGRLIFSLEISGPPLPFLDLLDCLPINALYFANVFLFV